MIDLEEIRSLFESHNSFVITTHVNPDADAIGSELALHNYLIQLGKDARIINFSATPYNLTFLDSNDVVETYNFEMHDSVLKSVDVIIAVDFNQLSRTVSMEKTIRQSKAVLICIDHHQYPERFSEHMFLDENCGSTGEIVYELFASDDRVNIDSQTAVQIYAAVMTDTGSFRFERTTPRTHQIAAELLERGVDQKWVYRELYDTGSLGKTKLLGRALSSIELNETGEICSMKLTLEDLKETGTTEADIEGFVNFTLSIYGVRIGLLFYELGDGFKVSFRSVDNIPINKLAAEFEGGGHFHAAGTRIYGKKMSEYLPKIIKAAEKYL